MPRTSCALEEVSLGVSGVYVKLPMNAEEAKG